MTGTVTVGGQPLVGATVSLWQTGLTSVQLGSSATTNSSGAFGLTFTCPNANTLMFVTAFGGHVGNGAANAAISAASALGACGSLPGAIVVNELTSAATAYAAAGFAPAAGSGAATFHGNATGLANAFLVETKLANAITGAFSSTGHESNTTAVQTQLDTVANAMAACNVSGSATSAACAELFSCARANATFAATGQPCTAGTSTAVSDTLSAALSVAQNAGLASPQGIVDVANGNSTFTPALSSAPADWSLAMVYSPVRNFGPLAIDSNGYVWVISDTPNTGPPLALSVLELDPTGVSLSTPASGWVTGGIAQLDTTDTTNMAIDAANNVWVGGSSPNIAEIANNGTGVASSNGWSAGTGPGKTAGVAIDISGNAWFADGNAGDVFKISSAGSNLSTSAGFPSTVCDCTGISADALGNVWLVGSGSQPGLAIMNSSGTQGSRILPPLSPFSLDAIATDGSGNLWITDQHNHGVWEYTPGAGSPWTPSSVAPFNNSAGSGTIPKGIAVDGAGHKWIANNTFQGSISSVTELSADGTSNLSPVAGLGSGTLGTGGAYSVAVDQAGNVWVASGGSAIIEFIGAGAPTKNPIVTGITSGSFAP
jgi:hypothetical protein